eukprot:3546371-Rhodomonas_salina.1
MKEYPCAQERALRRCETPSIGTTDVSTRHRTADWTMAGLLPKAGKKVRHAAGAHRADVQEPSCKPGSNKKGVGVSETNIECGGMSECA